VKLLFTIKRLEQASGGSERVLAHICSELARRGHDVSVLTWDRVGATPFYRFDSKVRILNREIGSSERRTGLFEFARRLLDLRNVVISERPDLAIGFGHSTFVLLAFAAIGSGVTAVGSEHAAMPHYDRRPLQYLLLRIATRLMAKVTVTSEDVGRAYTSDVRPKLIAVPNPILVDSKPPGPKRRNGPRVLNVGRLEEQKDQATLIRAFTLIGDEFPNWHLRIVGEGTLRPKLQAQIESSGLAGRIELAGRISEIGAEYAAADLLALSSTYESFGLVSLEAMSYGLPVVGFADCPGTNEVVEHDVTGVLAGNKPDRVTSFSDALRKLMSDGSLRERLGDAGRSNATRRAAACDSVDRWEMLLNSIHRGRNPASSDRPPHRVTA